MFDFLFKRKKSAATAPDVKTKNTVAVPAPPPPPPAAVLRQQALDQAGSVGSDEAAAVRFILSSGVAEARLVAAQAVHGKGHLEQVYKAMRETDRRVAKLMQQRLAVLAQQDLAHQRAQAVLAQAESLCDEPALRANQVVAVERDWQAIGAPPSAAAAAFTAAHRRLEQRLQAQAALQRMVLDASAKLRGILADESASHATIAGAAQSAGNTLAAATQHAELPSLPKQLLPELARLHERLQQASSALDAAAASIAAREAALDLWEAQAAMPSAPVDSTGIVVDSADSADSADRADSVDKIDVADKADSVDVADVAEVADSADIFDTADASGAADAPITPETDTAGDLAAAPAEPATPQATAVQGLPTIATLQQAWRALPVVADPVRRDALQQRFDVLLARLKPAPAPVPPSRARTASKAAGNTVGSMQEGLQAHAPNSTVARNGDTEEQRQQRAAALEALQAALEEGALQRAMEADRLLRGLDQEGSRATTSQQSALNAARAELGRLQGWARWGGTVSREELLAAVEALPAQELAITELAKKVGSMRERWRALDASAGPAPRALWLRFDTACTTAYAPVAAHFAVLSQERAANAQKAQELIDEVTGFVQGAGLPAAQAESTDWRSLAAFSQRVRTLWQRLGPIERKEHKRLGAAFAQALQPLALQLESRQQEELAARQALIDEVAGLPPQARDTPERLQALQARWQQAAKAFPLTRQEEQASWLRFRSACDAVFTERKNAGAAADAQRNAGLSQKQELCAVLERSVADVALTAGQRAALLRETRAQWDAAGPVPRAAQATLQARFEAAVQAIEAHRVAGQQAAARRQAEAVCACLALCQQAEHLLLAQDTGAVAALATRWPQPAAPNGELEQALRRRFDAALAAAAANDAAHAHLLQTNQAPRDAALLRLEVDYALESPPAFQRERLALQVAGLQSTFRAANTGDQQSARTRVAQLCALPAAADNVAMQRITRVIQAMHIEG